MKQIKKIIKTNRYIFQALNCISLFLIFILNILCKSKILRSEIKRQKITKGKALFIYSKKHFNPSKSRVNIEFGGTYSWSKFFYMHVLGKYDYIDYIDLYNFKLKLINKKYKLVIGVLSWSFILSKFFNPKARYIYIAVNSHPLYRNKRLIEESKIRNVNLTNECVNPILQILCYYIADVTLLAGNQHTKDTYLRYSPDINIVPISGGLLYKKYYPDYTRRNSGLIKIFYPTSYLGLRKGIFPFLDLLEGLTYYNFQKKICVVITGKIADGLSESITKRVSQLKAFDVIFLNWLSHKNLVQEIQSSNIVVSCSLEEGQPHGILEAIAGGCIPFVSRDCGIDLSSEYIFVEDDIKKSAKKLSSIIKQCEIDTNYVLSQHFVSNLKKKNNWRNVVTKINNFV
jgi:hypothetical protein